MKRIVVVGGGVAGLACATRLAVGGRAVTLLERSHRVGGRVSTRAAGGLSFNHGAQFASAREGGFAALMDGLRAEGVAAPWPAAGPGRWTGTPFMAAIPTAMASRAAAAGVELVLQAEVSALVAEPGGWRIEGAGAAAGPARGAGEDAVALVLAVPATGAVRLLQGMAPQVTTRLMGVTMAPCWTLMLGVEGRVGAPDVLRPEAGPVSWASRDSARPGAPAMAAHARTADGPGLANGPGVADGSGLADGRGSVVGAGIAGGVERWVVQAGPAWSRAWLGRSADEAGAALLHAFAALVGALPPVVHSVATLWRAARTEQALDEPCLWDAARGLGLCGDWCLGARVEAAWASGDALAGRILSGDAGAEG